MFKGYKVTKRLQDYISFARNKFDRLNENGEIDLWEVLDSYEMIKKQAQCMQYYIYDLVKGDEVHGGSYRVIYGRDGGTYVKINAA